MAAGLSVRPLEAASVAGALACEGAFTVTQRLVVAMQRDGTLDHAAVQVDPPYGKRYEATAAEDLATYAAGENGKAGFVADADGAIVGRVLLAPLWNRYGRVDDLAVAQAFRRKGVGMALMRRALAWARERGLAGVVLETQDVNVPACRLYERMGFVLGGFDRFLYRGLDPNSRETALYWYRTFDAAVGGVAPRPD